VTRRRAFCFQPYVFYFWNAGFFFPFSFYNDIEKITSPEQKNGKSRRSDLSGCFIFPPPHKIFLKKKACFPTIREQANSSEK